MNQERPRSVLGQYFSAPEFTPAEGERIQSKFTRTEHSKHTFLLREGETSRHYWLLESGLARSYAVNPRGADITTHFYGAGDIVIDWPSFFLRQPTRENIETLADCVCWRIDFDAFQELFHAIAAFRDAGRTRLVGSYFALKRSSVALIADRARVRYERLLREQPDVVGQVPLKQIATYLGVTDTSLSRIRREIARARKVPPAR